MSLQIIDEDQYTPTVHYGAGNYTISKKQIGTRYVLVAVRTLIDPIHHLIGTAIGWGGNPEKVALYVLVTLRKNDSATVYAMSVPANVPVDGFWSISVYNAEGYFQKNEYSAYSLNNITAKKDAGGSTKIQFGKILNCLPIMDGWNYTVRIYRPRAEILNGTWKFPEAHPVR